jgi:hypothetical protein
VTEAERGPTPFEETLTDTNFEDGVPAGDTFVTPEGDVVEFTNTDENEGETLIIKSDKREYDGLTKVTTFFNVTNTSNSSDEFKLQAYFPRGNGEVLEIKEWEQNQPREVLVPEYRPFVYHCEAGWEPTDAPASDELSLPAAEAGTMPGTSATGTSEDGATPAPAAAPVDVDADTATSESAATGDGAEAATGTADTPRFSIPGSSATGSSEVDSLPSVPAATSGGALATTAVSRVLATPSALLVAATSAPIGPADDSATSGVDAGAVPARVAERQR